MQYPESNLVINVQIYSHILWFVIDTTVLEFYHIFSKSKANIFSENFHILINRSWHIIELGDPGESHGLDKNILCSKILFHHFDVEISCQNLFLKDHCYIHRIIFTHILIETSFVI